MSFKQLAREFGIVNVYWVRLLIVSFYQRIFASAIVSYVHCVKNVVELEDVRNK